MTLKLGDEKDVFTLLTNDSNNANNANNGAVWNVKIK